MPALLAAAVVSIVLGIVGMHALSTHGVVGATDHSTMTSPATGPMTGSDADMFGDVSTGTVTATAGAHAAMPAGPDSGDGHSPGSMVMLCFAMLAATAGALLLLFLGLRRRPRIWAHRPTAPATVTATTWVTARLGTGPPYVWQFSVIRC